MGATEAEMTAILRSRKMIPTSAIRSRLLELDNLENVLNCANQVGFSRGILTEEILNAMLNVWAGETPTSPMASQTKVNVERAPELGRTIAPVKTPEPLDIQFRNNLPDWNSADFTENASDAPTDILVHYDITGNSITEGKMADITSCFSDRLQSIRKMIIQNSRLPRTPTEISRLHAESSRYQGYENKAVAIGLVNEPRYTKNGHLMWNLEDETGELTCLLTKRKGDDRDRAHEQILEAGLMPDDVLGVSGTFSQTGDMFYVDDLHFPMQTAHKKASSEHGVSVAFLSDIHVGSKTFLEAQWHKMVRWFHSDPLAKTVKYLILSGDCVDGVGIYPGQDSELSIPDLF